MTAALAVSAAWATLCTDTRCTDGITWCPGCNGWGAVNPKGKAYRAGHKGGLPAWAAPHGPCNGTGMLACGCLSLGPAELATLAGSDD